MYNFKQTPIHKIDTSHLQTKIKRNKAKSIQKADNGSEENVYYLYLRPVIIGLNIFCILPVRKFQEESRFYRYILNLTIFILFSIYGCISCLILRSCLNNIATSVHLHDTLFAFLQVMQMTYPFFTIVFLWPNVEDFSKQIVRWKVFQKSFQHTTGSPLEIERVNKLYSWTGYIFLLVVSSYTLYILYVAGKLSLWTAILCTYFVTSVNYISVFFVMDVDATKRIAKAFNAKFFKVWTVHTSPATIQDYRLLFLQLLVSVRASTKMMTMYKLLFITHKIMFIVLFIYWLLLLIITSVDKNEFKIDAISITVVSLIPAVAFLFLYSNTAYELTQQFSKLKMELLYYMKTPLYDVNTKAMNEIRLFSRSVDILLPSYNIDGFIIVDRGLSLKIFAHVVTYLIIIIQFNFSIDGHI